MITRWIMLLFLFVSMSLQAQFSLNYRQYTTKEGLPSSEVYHIMEDSKGFLWFSTDNGVSRFDGFEFKNYSTKHGLSDNVIFRSFEDDFGRIWFVGNNRQLSYLENGRIEPFQYNARLDSFIQNRSIFSNSIIQNFAAFNDTILFELHSVALIQITPKGKIEALVDIDSITCGSIAFYEYQKGKQVGVSVKKDSISQAISTCSIQFLDRQGNRRKYSIEALLMSGQTYAANNGRDSIFIASSRMSMTWLNGEFSSFQSSQTTNTWLFKDSKNHYWLGAIGEGVKRFKNPFESNVYDTFFEGKSISCILEDYQGNYWFSSTEAGVYMVPSLAVKHIEHPNYEEKVAYCIESYQDAIFFGGAKSHVFKFDHQKEPVEIGHAKTIGFEAMVLDLENREDSLFIFGARSFSKFKNGKFQSENKRGVRNLIHHKGYYLAGQSRVLLRLKHLWSMLPLHFTKLPSKYRIRPNDQILFDEQHLVASNYGIYAVNYVKDTIDNLMVYSGQVNDFEEHGSQLLCGTKKEGVLIYHQGNIIDTINQRDGLHQLNIVKIQVENDSTFWVIGNDGVNRIVKRGEQYLCTSITESDGLSSNEVNDLLFDDHYVWLATNEGVDRIDLKQYAFEEIKPRIQLSSLFVNQKAYTLTQDLSLPYDSNFVDISYSAIEFKNQDSLIYRYRIQELGDQWNQTTNRNVLLNGLAAGHYTFEIEAECEGVSERAFYRFEIRPPFWLTWWFITLVVLSIALTVYFLVKARYQRILEKAKMERKVLVKEREAIELKMKAIEEEQKALRSQMNPHFIFNALNSIYSFILSNETQQAANFLTKFSRLIRHILESSRNEFITIEDEVNMLSYYMELERLQKGGDFTFEFILDDEIMPDDDEIPSMIIQPYIENAILHGIQGLKDRVGHIKITFHGIENDAIQIEIEDNGIGRKASAEKKAKTRKKHKSIGIKNTQERIDVLKKKSGVELSIEIIDLEQGTKVLLTLPVIAE